MRILQRNLSTHDQSVKARAYLSYSRGLIKENSLKDHDAHDNDDDSDDYYTVILIMKVLAIIVMMMMVLSLIHI